MVPRPNSVRVLSRITFVVLVVSGCLHAQTSLWTEEKTQTWHGQQPRPRPSGDLAAVSLSLAFLGLEIPNSCTASARGMWNATCRTMPPQVGWMQEAARLLNYTKVARQFVASCERSSAAFSSALRPSVGASVAIARCAAASA